MIDNIDVFENFLSAEECDFILDKCKQELTLEDAKIWGDDNNDNQSNVKKIRKSSIAWISDLGFLNERLTDKLKDLIKINGMEVTGLGNFQFTEYKEGEFYDWHVDSTSLIERERFVSIVIQLNNTYTGGNLEIKNIKGELVPIKNKLGSLYVFNSRLFHRVSPVDGGIRYSLVNWVSLIKTDSKKQNLL
jgi:predicted 2-oxoglutarate/Fe(II)-dependent dioxygenase YbiX